jgi:hypothetical protein
MSTDLAALAHDLETALVRRGVRRSRRRRLTTTGLLGVLASAAAATAIAAGTGFDLPLDPAQWRILGAGDVDGGRGAYVHAERTADGSRSTFLVEHDDGLAPYEAFLLHERTVAAAGRSEQGELCTPAQLTEAERAALSALRAGREPAPAVQCRGLDYAVEQARLVVAGVQPASKLMPGTG